MYHFENEVFFLILVFNLLYHYLKQLEKRYFKLVSVKCIMVFSNFLLFFFCSYALFHATRKTFSNVKVTISETWTPKNLSLPDVFDKVSQVFLLNF